MRSTINNGSIVKADASRISQSKIDIPESQHQKLEAEIKKVKYPTYAISNAEYLGKKIESFSSEKVKSQLAEKLVGVNSYRQVRGDGNCFFRALAFSYISSIKEPKFYNCFKYIDEITLTCCHTQSIPKDFVKFYSHPFLSSVLRDNWDKAYRNCYLQAGKMNLKALLKLFTEYPFLDFIVILYFRSLCLKALWKYRTDFKSFLVGSEDTAIRTYHEETEGVAIQLCSKMLDIKIYIYEVRKDQVHVYSYANVTKELTSISLLFSNNHYDIVEYNDNISAEKSVLKEKDDYYTPVNQKMKEGICIQCGFSNPIYIESGLCFRCYEASLNTLHNFSKTEKFVKGKCGQCFKIKENISEALGLCKDCLYYQSQMENRRKAQIPKETKYAKCLICHYNDHVLVETGLCKYCTKDSQKLAKTYEKKQDEKRIPPSDQSQQIPERDSKIRDSGKTQLSHGRCSSCRYNTTISSQTRLCRQCANNQRRMMERISPSKDRNMGSSNIKASGQFKEFGDCKICKFKQKLDRETLICQDCTKNTQRPSNSRIQNRYKCKKCEQNFKDKLSIFSEGDGMCLQCLKKDKSFEDCTCRQCGKIKLSNKEPFQNGICGECKKKKSRIF